MVSWRFGWNREDGSGGQQQQSNNGAPLPPSSQQHGAQSETGGPISPPGTSVTDNSGDNSAGTDSTGMSQAQGGFPGAGGSRERGQRA
eukprot:5025777-Ditylum_brightwellii.AAC.1